jgi:hypothetical protein
VMITSFRWHLQRLLQQWHGTNFNNTSWLQVKFVD